jgi:hypothetical protein
MGRFKRSKISTTASILFQSVIPHQHLNENSFANLSAQASASDDLRIADAIRWAERIMEEIDQRHPTKQEISRSRNQVS